LSYISAKEGEKVTDNRPYNDDKFAFKAWQAVRAWRRLEEAWPRGMPEPTGLIDVSTVGNALDRCHLQDLFECFVQVFMRSAMDAEPMEER
jgi:hypothetical protein